MNPAKSNHASGRLPKPNSVIVIPTSLKTDFFKKWCIFLRPICHLTDREIEIFACFLQIRWELSKETTNPTLLDAALLSDNVKERVMERCNLTLPYFQVMMSTLRKKKVILDTGINPKYIPNIRVDDNGIFQLLFLFKETEFNGVQ